MIKLDFQSRAPIYMQLVRGVCELIVLGQLKEHDPLPSVRNLARDLGINPNTIQKAYQELEASEVIYSMPGKGSYASDPKKASQLFSSSCMQKLQAVIKEARLAGITKEDIIDFIEKQFS